MNVNKLYKLDSYMHTIAFYIQNVCFYHSSLHMEAIILITQRASLTGKLVWWMKLLQRRWLLRTSTSRGRNPVLVNRQSHRGVINSGNVMDAWPFPLLFHTSLAEEILLGMTSNLSWRSCHHYIPWNTPPITLAEFFQSN